MERPARILAVGLAAASLACAGCPSLDALECHGSSCADGAVAADGGAGDGPAGEAGPASGIFCSAGAACDPTQECCLGVDGSTTCTPTFGCHATDIFCDDPSQCPGGGTCWICVNAQGFQGTSCDYQNDIVRNDGCDQTTAHALCHSSSQCEAGTTCKPFDVPELDAGTGATWFMACQP